MNKLSLLALLLVFFSCEKNTPEPPLVDDKENECYPTLVNTSLANFPLKPIFIEGELAYFQIIVDGTPTDEAVLQLDYDDQGRIIKVYFKYASGEPSSSYTLIEYNDDLIEERYYYYEEGIEDYTNERHITYTVDNTGKITALTRHATDPNPDYREQFTYDNNDNVVQVTYYEGEIFVRSETLEYDNSPNPFHHLGFIYDDDGFFSLLYLSKNIFTTVENNQDQSVKEFTTLYSNGMITTWDELQFVWSCSEE